MSVPKSNQTVTVSRVCHVVGVSCSPVNIPWICSFYLELFVYLQVIAMKGGKGDNDYNECTFTLTKIHYFSDFEHC